jgi:outer membrane usher protein
VRIADGQGVVFLDQIPKLTFHYDDARQSVALTLPDELRLPRIYDARNVQKRLAPTSDTGLLVNYTLFAGSVEDLSRWELGFSGANASLDAHLFSPLGVLNQSGIVGTTTFSNASALRLESDYTYSDPDHALTYRAGDTISGGLAWTRPIRMGGLQVQRDFTLRSDLVTAPLPQISGTAAVPSSVDVFVNGTRTYSQEVAPGPFSLTNLPLIAQNGVAQVVVRDATGREVDTSLSLFNPGRLLAPGLVDFSVETGLERLNYGSASDDYGREPIGSASLRGGFSDWFTGEAHAEGGGGLANAGGGALTRFASYGILTTALSASHYAGHIGLQAYGSYEWQSPWLSVQIGSQRTFGTYLDLASITEGPGGGILSAVGDAAAQGARSRLDRSSSAVRQRQREHRHDQPSSGQRKAVEDRNGVAVL